MLNLKVDKRKIIKYAVILKEDDNALTDKFEYTISTIVSKELLCGMGEWLNVRPRCSFEEQKPACLGGNERLNGTKKIK